jgi:hypothetical protein
VAERLPLGPDAELWPCWNGEACAVYNATDNATHGCTVGYAGALCGVCDAAAGYGRFGEVCAPCWSRGASEAFLAGAVIALVGVMGWFALRRSDGVKSPASIALKITLSFLQVRTCVREGGAVCLLRAPQRCGSTVSSTMCVAGECSEMRTPPPHLLLGTAYRLGHIACSACHPSLPPA